LGGAPAFEPTNRSAILVGYKPSLVAESLNDHPRTLLQVDFPNPPSYPWDTDVGDISIRFRLMQRSDHDAILAFTRELAERDRLFLRTDITDPAVVDSWIGNIEQGKTITVLAQEDEHIIGYCSLHHSEIQWTRHLGEMRLLVGSAYRGKGVGQQLAHQVFAIAQTLNLQKLVAQMMSSQRSAQNLFHNLGFIPEAFLHDWVIDTNGRTHDFILMSREVETED
jgi:L-amino acid N-acyltransferase YncA